MPYTSSWGDIYTISATMRADLYSFNDFDPATDDPNPDGPPRRLPCGHHPRAALATTAMSSDGSTGLARCAV